MADLLKKILAEVDKVVSFDFLDMNQLHHLFDKLLHIIEKLIKDGVEYVPVIERFALDTLDAMFAPRQIVKQAMLIAALQCTLLGWNSAASVVRQFYYLFTSRGQKEKQLLDELSNCKSYSEWKEVAGKLDSFRGLDKWRKNPESSLYDYKLVKKRIEGTKEMLERGDVFDLMFRIRGALARDQFGIQHEGLFNRALSGSKHLIESYHETMATALNFICDSPIADEEVSSLQIV